MAMRRQGLARVINLVAPGSGLVLLRREWLGLAVAALFAVLGQVVVLGWWVVPLDVPRWMPWVAGAVAVVLWAHAQWLLHCRIRLNASPVLAEELADLRSRAADALVRGDHAEAQRVLQVALSIDDEDMDVAVLWARLKSAQGERDAARRGWRRVLALSPGAEQRRAARDALAAL